MKKVTFLSTAIITLLFSACKNDSEFEGFTKAENGLNYKFFNHDENGAKVLEGDGITFSYLITNNKNDSLIVDSKSVSQDGSGYTKFLMPKTSFVGSLEDGMAMMAKGDSAAFIFSADSFFLKTMRMNELPPQFKPGEKLKAIVKIKDVINKKDLEANQKQQMAEQEAKMKEAEGQEKIVLDKYLADNKITVKPTESGLYLIETKKGSGAKPKAGDEVEVNYTGRLLDGKMFDSSIEKDAKEGNVFNPQRPYGPFKFILGQGAVIKGWDEAIGMLSKGGKAKIILPSNLGYGPNGGGPIPPFSPLAFEVELVSFGPAPAQPEGQMPPH
ncbi:MAG: FKBP-type peptidyl-prolyl cis-trans isomerase [Bacteroidota bacterium]|nr:FKBP-type peptidyl-prolyl cis-trans isomerase [Bacteroidota bacterium]MDP3146471.1 FKBP-type peptidyl-prolyl cis-trans isomerase [Bacteroidota bacterium]MDP3558637.1 FKBP-type peptidyl-prolyl cis-trans isomerase [Bacteroidota bacterium]